MSLTARLQRGWDFGEQDAHSKIETLTYTNGSLIAIDVEVDPATSDEVVDAEIDVSALKALYLESDQDVTIETNQAGGSSGAADDTLALSADVPRIWSITDGLALCPLTTDVDTLYVTNDGATAANVKIRGIQDPTA